ncbi:MAG: butyrate kinase, partial [Deltaproteobacteria bacterium]
VSDYRQQVEAHRKRRQLELETIDQVLFERPVYYRKPGSPITSTDDLIDAARLAVHEHTPPRIALVGSDNDEALLAARWAGEEGRFRLARFLLVGDSVQTNELAYELDLDIDDENFVIVDTDEPVEKSMQLLLDGQADFVMKGSVKTEKIMHGLLRALKGSGRLEKGQLVSHVVAMDLPRRSKFLLITDAAINPYPDRKKKIKIIENALRVARCLNIPRPRVAVISAIESVNPGIESSIEAEQIAGHFAGRKDCMVEGPLSFDVATDPQSAEEKRYKGEVAGNADILLMPDIDAANVLYKTLTTQSGAVAAGITVCGGLPVVLTSRGDSARTKLASIALAVRFYLKPDGG